MKNNITEIVFILDRSGSMEGLEADYQVGGCTALLDAIGDAVTHIGNIHKYARKEDIPAKTLFVITTDGMENVSHRYSAKQIRQMIRCQQSKYGWEFLFLGANIDAVEAAENEKSPESMSMHFGGFCFGAFVKVF